MMQIFNMEKKNVLNNRRNDESMYKNQFDSTHKDIEKNCAKNKFYYNYENHRYYNGKLKNTFVRRATGTSSKIICDEYVIDRRLNLQQFEHLFAKNTNCRRVWPNYKSTNSSKLTLAMTILKTLKATYWVHYRIICEQTNVLLHAKVTSNQRNMYNVRCAHILCCRRLKQRSIIEIHTALNVLQAINRLIQRSIQLTYVMFITLIMLMQVKYTTQLLSTKAAPAASNDTILKPTENIGSITIYKDNNNNKYQTAGRDSDTDLLVVTKSGVSTGLSNAYLDKLDNLERSLAAVLIKVAYGTTSTTKRSIPDNNYVPSLTTVATPLLTTLRYQKKQPQLKYHRNYELDLERDHALPTSAPNADILKSNSNPTYPNPNRQHIYNRERHRHVLNSTPLPSLPNDLKENGRLPTISLLSGVLPPHYSPPARSFFTPPLPPEYQHPFADKPTLRGTNDEGAIVTNAATFVQRRPIPPPSLMPGHERIPFRPADVLISSSAPYLTSDFPLISTGLFRSTAIPIKIGKLDVERKKNLNMPSKNSTLLEKNKGGEVKVVTYDVYDKDFKKSASNQVQIIKEVLPSIRRILSGSKGRKSDVPDVLLKQVTISSKGSMHQQSPSSPIVLFNNTPTLKNDVKDINVYSGDKTTAFYNTNINKSVVMKITHNLASGLSGDFLNTQLTFNHNHIIASTAEAIPTFDSNNKTTSGTSILISSTTDFSSSANNKSVEGEDGGSSSSTSTLASNGFINSTWNIAWNIHVYLSVILFTILAVYSLYKMITYNKLTHLFAQSYFVCIHLVLIIICTMRIFYLCYDAYNIHASLPIFISEILLNLPSTFLTISFSVLILFLSLKSLNHKNNRYSALIRPLTVVIGCGVHVILCITLHYVESYTFHQHYQQHFIYQQQQQLLRRHQVQLQQQNHYVHPNFQQNLYQQFLPSTLNNLSAYGNQQVRQQLPIMMSANIAAAPPPPRVLSLICQIIYIFVCFSLGFLYLYMYRILKRILRNKSQNYIHGYQNLSYAIHISIATALLYILLAVIQLVGAISITSTSRLIISQINTDIDWMQWGFQFSIRLIEIAIITLTSWVAGLTNNGGGSSINGSNVNMGISHGETPLCMNISTRGSRREKPLSTHQQSQHQNHSTVAGFFLPCTYTSSQEHFETDYPVVCNANSNIHTYTMRTGKLIYEDSFVLNSMAGNNASGDVAIGRADGELQNSEYNSGSTSNHNVIDCSGHHSCKQQSQYIDYLTDNNTDHYENPNFDLRDSGPTLHLPNNDANQKFQENSMTSTKGLSSNESNFGSNTNSDLLLQSGGSYSEPCPQTYEYRKFQCSTFEKSHQQSIPHTSVETPIQNMFIKREGKKIFNASECNGYEKPERHSASSSYFGSGNGNSRFANYNTYELSSHKSSVRKSETLNTIVNTKHGRNASSSSAASSNSACGPRSTASDVLSKVSLCDNRYNHHQNHSYQMTNAKGSWVNHYVMPRINTQQYVASSNTLFNGRCATIERTNFAESQKITKSNGVNSLAYSDEEDDEFTLSVSSNHQL